MLKIKTGSKIPNNVGLKALYERICAGKCDVTHDLTAPMKFDL